MTDPIAALLPGEPVLEGEPGLVVPEVEVVEAVGVEATDVANRLGH